MAINFPNDPAVNPGDGGTWVDPQVPSTGTWQVELIGGEAVWTLISGPEGAGASLAALSDTDINTPTNNQIIAYNATTQKWVNLDREAIPTNLGDLTDVTVTTPADGESLVYEGGTWINKAGGSGGIEEAPNDGAQYARQNEGWQVVALGDGTAEPELAFEIGATGTASYDFTGPGFTTATANPLLTLVRGQTYVFNNTSGSHPFQIQSTAGIGGDAYNDGVTNNNTVGAVIFEVPFDAPSKLYYQCTAHADMNGEFDVLVQGSGGATLNIDEAPADGVPYARKDNGWVPAVEAVPGSTAQIEGANNIDTGAAPDLGRSAVEGEVLTFDGTKFAPAAPASGLPETGNEGDILIYNAVLGEWVQAPLPAITKGLNLTTTYGRTSQVDGVDMAGADTYYITQAEAEADGWTVLLFDDSFNETYDDDSFSAGAIPADYQSRSWLDYSPGTTPIKVYGNGAIFFAEPGEVEPNNYEATYQNTNQNTSLLFALHNVDMVLDAVMTKEVTVAGEDYFVIRAYWYDLYEAIGADQSGGGGGPARSANRDERRRTKKPELRMDPDFNWFGEVWLGKQGSLRMMHGTLVGGDYIVEAQSGFDDFYCNGIYLKGLPAEKYGSLTSFTSLGMAYTDEQTNGGTENTPAGNWYLWDQIIPAPAGDGLKLEDLNNVDVNAPNDGDAIRWSAEKQQWVNAAAGGGGSGSFSGISTLIDKVLPARETDVAAIRRNPPESPTETALVNRKSPSTNDSFYGCQLSDMSQVVAAYMLSMDYADSDFFDSQAAMGVWNFSTEIPKTDPDKAAPTYSIYNYVYPQGVAVTANSKQWYKNSWTPYFLGNTKPSYWNPTRAYAAPELDGEGELTVNFNYHLTNTSGTQVLCSYRRITGIEVPGTGDTPATVWGWQIVCRNASIQVDITREDEFGTSLIQGVLNSDNYEDLFDVNIANGGGGDDGGGAPARTGFAIDPETKKPRFTEVGADMVNLIMVHELDEIAGDGTYRWRLILNGVVMDEVDQIDGYDWLAYPSINEAFEGRPRLACSGEDDSLFINSDAGFINQQWAKGAHIWGFWATRTSVFKFADLRLIDPDTFEINGPPLNGGLNALYGGALDEPDGQSKLGIYLNYLGFDCHDISSPLHTEIADSYFDADIDAFQSLVKGTHPGLHPVHCFSNNLGGTVSAQSVDVNNRAVLQFKNVSAGWKTAQMDYDSGAGKVGIAQYELVGPSDVTELPLSGRTWGNTTPTNLDVPILRLNTDDELEWTYTQHDKRDLKPANFTRNYHLTSYYGDQQFVNRFTDDYRGYDGIYQYADKTSNNYLGRVPTRALPYGNPSDQFVDNGNEPWSAKRQFSGQAFGGRFMSWRAATSLADFATKASGSYWYDETNDWLYINTQDQDGRIIQMDTLADGLGESIPFTLTVFAERSPGFRTRWLPVVASSIQVAANPIGTGTPIANALALQLNAGDGLVSDDNSPTRKINEFFDGSDVDEYPAINDPTNGDYLMFVLPERHPHAGEVLQYNGVTTYEAKDGNTLAGLPLGPKTPRYEFLPTYGDTDWTAAGAEGLIGFPDSNSFSEGLYIQNVDANGETVDLAPWINDTASSIAGVNILRVPMEFGLISPDGEELGASARFAPNYQVGPATADVNKTFNTTDFWVGESAGLPNSKIGWKFPAQLNSAVSDMVRALGLTTSASFFAGLRTAGYKVYLRPILDWKVVQDGDSLVWNDFEGYWEIGSGGGGGGAPARNSQEALLAEIEKDPEAFRKALGL